MVHPDTSFWGDRFDDRRRHYRVWRALVTGLPAVCVASALFEALCQLLVGLSDSIHLLPGFRVVKGVGSHGEFFSACSQFGD
jgi:hypothetical protein